MPLRNSPPLSPGPGRSPWLGQPWFWMATAAVCLTFWAATTMQLSLGAHLAGRPPAIGAAVWFALAEPLLIAASVVTATQLGHHLRLAPGRALAFVAGHLVISLGIGLATVALFSLWTTVAPGFLFDPDAPLTQRFTTLLLGGMLQGYAVIYWSALGITQALTYRSHLQTREARAARLESQLHAARLRALRARLEPHFLFNSLNAISTGALEDGSSRTARRISRLAGFLRRVLDDDELQEIELRREIAQIEDYLAIERWRFGDRLQVELEIAPEVERALVPALLLQPLVENAVRHGLAPRAEGGTLRLSAFRRGGDLLLRVGDTGRGLDPASPRGHGLGITSQRLDEHYGDAASLELRPGTPGGTEARILLPFHTSTQETP